MARDVDLSSREWCDLVFEGKNKEFGAYELRTQSVKRHNKAVIFTVIGALLLVGIVIGVYQVQQMIAESEIADNVDQEEVVMDMGEVEEETPEDKYEEPEPEEEQITPEELMNTAKVTEIAIVDDDQVREEDKVKNLDELKQEESAFGSQNVDNGSDDRLVTREKKEAVVVEEKKPEPVKKEEKKVEPEKVFQSVEQMPTFPGGDAALMKYLSSHIQYPTMAQENNIQGRVVVQFVVTKTGQVGEVKVVRSVDKELDREAVRVCKSLPKFVPGRQNGQAVNVWYTLPVTFKLQNAN